MSDTEMTFTPEFAAALLEWDDRLFKVFQARHHAKTLIPTLREMSMTVCAKNAQRIYQDIDLQLRTGELLIRMRAMFLAEHTLSAVEHEQWRQFTNTAMVWNELTEEETGTEFGEKTLEVHQTYLRSARAALNIMEEAL